jgi:SAM-dependent methyltransferase
MKDRDDAFGHELHDYYQGKEVVELIERDDGFIDGTSAAPAVYFRPYDEWPAFEKQAVDLARGKVLDIGCGAGRHALYLQQQGLDVLGIDVSPLALEVCRQRGLRKTMLMPVTAVSSRLGTFDTILMMGNNFGLFANRVRARWLLRRWHRLMSEQGRIIAASNDPYQTDDPVHLAYHKRNLARGRMAGQIRLRVRYRRLKGLWFDYLMVSQVEMRQLLLGTGWEVVRFIDSDTPSYFAIIEKTAP